MTVKKFILSFCLAGGALYGQTADSSWKTAGFIGLNFSQTTLSNWQGGGQDNLSFNGIFNLEANYKKGRNEWANRLDAQYGIILQGGSRFWKKNADQLLAVSKYNVPAFPKFWYYSAMADFRTQFSPGYNYSGDTSKTLISDFMAPAYIQLALGLDFKPDDHLSVTLSPLAGKITIVNNQSLADNGDYGVKKAVRDSAGNVITPGEKVRYEFGGRVTVKYKKDILQNVNLDTYADFFSNYFDRPENIDVVWNTLVTFKINTLFTAMVSTKFIYDNDITIKYDWDKDGKYDHPNDIYGPRDQWLTVIGIGFGYKF
jgi:hypothetical protein